ncbi:MAG: response regulator [Desulfobacterales bacterium]|nr:response regulator [Desulfobacterales bacterium]MBF0396721.1 response regulator [Desulfobacterales bacterium]
MIKKILIVDDSPVARKMLKKCIPDNKGYEIFEATNGQEGVNKYQEIRPDVTIMDLTMPVLDGYGATAQIKKFDKNAIIIVMTADIQRQSITKALELGAFTLIKKPPAKKESIEAALEKAEMKIQQIAGVNQDV